MQNTKIECHEYIPLMCICPMFPYVHEHVYIDVDSDMEIDIKILDIV